MSEHTKEPLTAFDICFKRLKECTRQRDELLEALRPIAERGEISAAIINQSRASGCRP